MSWDTPAFQADSNADSWQDAPEQTTDAFADGNAVEHSEDHVITAENTSKHANGPSGPGGCFNCGEEGHMKCECTNPTVERAFDGLCHTCNLEGHRASDCPNRPAQMCKACGGEGHLAAVCESPRLGQIHPVDTLELTVDDAWTMLEEADKAKDLETFKLAFHAYTRAQPDVTFVQVESALREAQGNVYLIAKEQPIADTHTVIDLQGKINCAYVIAFHFSRKPNRPKFAGGWPSSPEENLERLANAGFVRDRMVPKCRNCGEMGHISKACTEERNEPEKIEISCGNCKETGHYLRDCPQPRFDPNLCRNCKQPGHRSNDCTEPKSAEGVECKNCNEVGHFSRDCPTKPKFTCRRCGEEGHKSSECTEERKVICFHCQQEGHDKSTCTNARVARDYSKVQCSVCKQMGHTHVRCPEKREEEEADKNNDDGSDNGGFGSGGDAGAFAGGSGAAGGW